jgi:hypothetical protein
MSKEIGFSVADDIKDFVDFYADIRLTTPSAMAKKGMVAEIIRHPLQQEQIEEYEKRHGPVPMACFPARCRTGTDRYISSPNSLKNQESHKDKKELETYAEGVEMAPADYLALCSRYAKPVIDLAIQKVSAQQIKTGKRYPSPRGAILQWGIRAALEDQKKHPEAKKTEFCPECHVGGGAHGVSCSRSGVDNAVMKMTTGDEPYTAQSTDNRDLVAE